MQAHNAIFTHWFCSLIFLFNLWYSQKYLIIPSTCAGIRARASRSARRAQARRTRWLGRMSSYVRDMCNVLVEHYCTDKWSRMITDIREVCSLCTSQYTHRFSGEMLRALYEYSTLYSIQIRVYQFHSREWRRQGEMCIRTREIP